MAGVRAGTGWCVAVGGGVLHAAAGGGRAAPTMGAMANRRDLYGRQHVLKRQRLREELALAGSMPCARCGLPVWAAAWLVPADPLHVPSCVTPRCCGECWCTWDTGHADEGSVGGVEHRSCNRAAGGRNGAAAVNGRNGGTMVVRPWGG